MNMKTVSDVLMSTDGSDRDVLMTAVHAALGHTRTQPAPPPPVVDDSIARLAHANEDLAELFIRRAEEVGMVVERTSWQQVVAKIVGVLGEHKVERISVALTDQWNIATQVLEQADVAMVVGTGGNGVSDLDCYYDADAGITDVQAALAETGTLICTSSAIHSRAPSMLPPLHVALLRRSDIMPDMIDYWAMQKGKRSMDLPSSITFITGPSKTSDIEGILVTGVHGPMHVHILLVEDA